MMPEASIRATHRRCPPVRVGLQRCDGAERAAAAPTPVFGRARTRHWIAEAGLEPVGARVPGDGAAAGDRSRPGVGRADRESRPTAIRLPAAPDPGFGDCTVTAAD